MPRHSGPNDVYRDLVRNSDEGWLYGLVAFAVVEEQCIEWMEHQKAHTGSYPGHAEIQSWYEQQSEHVLLRAKIDAENALLAFVEKSQYEAGVAEARESFVVSEIRKFGGFWRNVSAGVVAAVLFASLLALFAFLAFFETSIVSIVQAWLSEAGNAPQL